MKQACKSLSLILFSICCVVGFNLSASALTLDKDTPASEISLENNVVIDGQSKYKITGGINIKDGQNITLKNLTMDGEGTKDILIYLTNAGEVTLENVTFVNYTKAGIYGEALSALTVNNSSFDASDTVNIGDYPGNPEEELIKRSAAGIDLNLGNGAKYDVNVKYIIITNNEFKNVTDTAPNSTAGAIKVKVKDASRISGIGTITISNNAFTDNVRDLVIGTDSPASGTTQSKTGDLDIVLKGNSAMNVVNNSKDGSSEILEGTYKLNYAQDVKYELNSQMYYTITKDVYATLDEQSFYDLIKSLKEDSDILGVTIENDNYKMSFKTADIDLSGLQVLVPIKFEVSDTTSIEGLKDFEKSGVNFITTNAMNAKISGLTADFTLDSIFNGNLYLYSYDSTDGLKLVSNVTGTSGSVSLNLTDIKENYVISNTELKSEENVTVPGEGGNTPSDDANNNDQNVNDTVENDIENPQTYDPFESYLVLCLVSLITLVGSVIYIKKRVLN